MTETTALLPPPSPPQTSPAWREALRQQGIDPAMFQDEAALARMLVTVADHASKLEAQGQTNQSRLNYMRQANSMTNAPQQAPGNSLNPKDWLHFFTRDQAGNVVPKPGAEYALSPAVTEAVQGYFNQRVQHANGLADDPVGYLMPLMREQLRAEMREEMQAGLAAREQHYRQQVQQAQTQQWIDKNANWIYEADGETLTREGNRLMQIAQDASAKGLAPEHIRQYAADSLRNELIQETVDVRPMLEQRFQEFGQQQALAAQQAALMAQQQMQAQQQAYAFQQPPQQQYWTGQPQHPSQRPAPQQYGYQPQPVPQPTQYTPPQRPQAYLPSQGGAAPPQTFLQQAGVHPGAWQTESRSGEAAGAGANSIADNDGGGPLDLEAISRSNKQAAGLMDEG